jgi:hypothetical protein
MSDLRTLLVAAVVAALPLASAGADPLAVRRPGLGPVDTRSTLCDYRGCFGFGPQQWHRPAYVQPNFRPRSATGRTYYRPPGSPPPVLTYDPPPLRRVQPTVTSRHAEWCRNEYRSYNPRTDRFLTYEGVYKTCRSPYN